jgi:SAM-dependent methyltransferase
MRDNRTVEAAEPAGTTGLMQVDWAVRGARHLPCPVCGDGSAKPMVLSVQRHVERAGRGSSSSGPLSLVRCPTCGSAFYDDLTPAQYEDPGYGAIKFYVEQGAGLEAMLKPLCRFTAASVRTYLEIGCAFGYSLDFARFALGWQCRGLDPSSLAAAGRDALSLDIVSTYLGPDTKLDEHVFDLVHCSEVIEHIPDPHPFLAAARRLVAPAGALSVTTPNGAAIRPETSGSQLVTTLGPGQHLVLFTRASLERILRASGFSHVHVWEQPSSLHAVASSVPYPVRDAPAFDGDLFRRYLAERAATVSPGTSIAAGFDYRLFKTAISAGDFTGGLPPHGRLCRLYAERYGLDLASPQAIDLTALSRAPFDDFARACPFNLTGVLFFQGIVAMNHRDDYALALESFRAAARAGLAIRTVLRAIGADDGETEELVWQARTHAMYCLAYLDPPQAVREMETLNAAPGPAAPHVLWEVPAALVTRAGIELCRRLADLGHEAEVRRMVALLEEPRASTMRLWQRLGNRARRMLAHGP